MVEGLAKEHICTPHGHSSGDGQREGAAGRVEGAKWGEIGTSAIASTIKIKKNKKLWVNS